MNTEELIIVVGNFVELMRGWRGRNVGERWIRFFHTEGC